MLQFTKMHGAGNDYIYVNGFDQHIEDLSGAAIKLSDRHYGVGSDGLVAILPSESCDFRMRMFNSDGSEAEMCGNASRCVAKYVFEKGLTDKTEITLETGAGKKVLKLNLFNNIVTSVTVDMGEPVLLASDIPVVSQSTDFIDKTVIIGNDEWKVTCVSMGNPHAVVFTKEIENLDLPVTGPLFENNSLFPSKVNTEFVSVVDRNNLRMRVWERGAGETLACGTGACAVLVASVLNNLTERKATVSLLGGDLNIEWDAVSNHVFMTGPAEFVFEGTTNLV